MKRIFLLLTLICSLTQLSAQVIKLENGVSLSSMTGSDEIKLFPYTAAGYTGRIGIEWLEHRWFYLSSEVGYMATGGKDHILITADSGFEEGYQSVFLRRDNIHINTTFRVKLAYYAFHTYLGIGPKLDIPVNIYSGYEEKNTLSRKVMAGIKTEIGCAYDFSHCRLGLNIAYLPDITKQSSYLGQNLRNNIWTVGFSVGYIL